MNGPVFIRRERQSVMNVSIEMLEYVINADAFCQSKRDCRKQPAR